MFKILIRVSPDRLAVVLEYLQSEGLEVILCPRSDLFKEKTLVEKTLPEEAHSKSIHDLGLTPRALNCLINGGINTIGELVQKRGKELLRIKNFGDRCLDEVKSALAKMGLSLKG